MAKVGGVNIKITAETKKFEAGTKKATQQVKGFSGAIGKSLGVLKSFSAVGALSIGGVVAGMSLLVKSSFSAIDATAKLATALGTTTESIEGLKFAAGIAGVGSDEMTKAMSRMTRGIGQARQGLGAQKRAFESLGLSADTLAKKDPSAAMVDILDAMARMPNVADRAAVAADIFGREGLKLLPLATEGADGIKALVAEGASLAGFSTDGAKAVEAANDAMLRMKTAITGAARAIAIGLAPAVSTAATLLKDFIVGLRQINFGSVETAAKIFGVVTAFSATLYIVPKLIAGFKAIVGALKAVAASEAIALSFGGPAGWAALAVSVGVAAGALYGIDKAFDKVNDTMAAATTGTDKTTAAVNRLAVAMKKFQPDDFVNVLGQIKTIGDVNSEIAKTIQDSKEGAYFAGLSADEKTLERIALLSGGYDTPAYDAVKQNLELQKERENLASLDEEFAKLNEQINDFGKSDIDKQLKAFYELGATAEEIRYAREQLEQIQALKDAANGDQLKGGSFEQVVVSRIVIGGNSQQQSESKKQTNYLKEIATNTRSNTGGVPVFNG